MLKQSRYLILSMVIVTLFFSCKPKDRYNRLVRAELAKGIRVDSLFLDLHLGMTDKEFYTQCWELNKKDLIRQGTSNTSVLYKMNELKNPAEMNFYPSFYKDRIYEMPVKYHYEGWAPWNNHLSSDSLQQDILKLYKEWYGDDFMEVQHRKRGTAYIKVDGNRRITIFKMDERQVSAIFTDLLVEKEIKELHKKGDSLDVQSNNKVNPVEEALGISD